MTEYKYCQEDNFFEKIIMVDETGKKICDYHEEKTKLPDGDNEFVEILKELALKGEE